MNEIEHLGGVIRVLEYLSTLLKESQFKDKIRIIVGRYDTSLERREIVIEGIGATWTDNPPGLFLNDAELYDFVYERVGGSRYTVNGSTPKFSNQGKRVNVQKKEKIFVSARSILQIEFSE